MQCAAEGGIGQYGPERSVQDQDGFRERTQDGFGDFHACRSALGYKPYRRVPKSLRRSEITLVYTENYAKGRISLQFTTRNWPSCIGETEGKHLRQRLGSIAAVANWVMHMIAGDKMVGAEGLEPPTSCV